MCHTVTTGYICGCEETSDVIQCAAVAGTTRTCAYIDGNNTTAISHPCAACVAEAAAARQAQEEAARANGGGRQVADAEAMAAAASY